MRSRLLLSAAFAAACLTSLPAAAGDIPSLRDRPVSVRCYQHGTQILEGDASQFELSAAGSAFLDFQLVDGRAAQIREVGDAVCVVIAKEPDAKKN